MFTDNTSMPMIIAEIYTIQMATLIRSNYYA